MKETNLTGKTPDIAEENIQKLKQLFPEVFTEGKIDFEKLQQVLGEYVEDSNERYNFTWNGKGRALRLSQTPSLGTLRPCKEESKNWDTTENLYIEGDNLEVLKLLQKSYYGKVKMIYIDPPYNTGKDFVYNDDFHDSLENYKRITGQVDGNGKAISTNAETSGRYHTNWLNMMYPRLRLARNLLTDDGVIFISIDDNEVDNLKKICNEVFGEDNFIAMLPTVMNLKGNQDEFAFAGTHEYTIVYSKKRDEALFNEFAIEDEELNEWEQDEYGYFKKGANLKATGVNAPREKRPNLWFPIYVSKDKWSLEYFEGSEEIYPLTDGKEMSWRWSKNKFINEHYNVIVSYDNGNVSIYKKQRPSVGDIPSKKPKTLFYKAEYSSGNGTNEVKELLGERIFSNPKPINLLKDFCEIGCTKDGIILDLFAGSSTTAHAVMQLNAKDGGERKFIMVQLPEPTDEKSEAYKAGYKNICEIGKERIRRAGEKIKEKYKDKGNIENLDIGFKVFKLDTSNIRKWQPDYDNLEQSLLDYVDNFVEGRTELDVVYEIMLKYGLDLTYPVDEFTIAQKKVYSIGYGMLMICLDNEITTEVAKGILAKIKELSPESSRVVFKDNGFKSDSNKTNIKEILKSGGIEEFITI
ncbi:adenine-specific DNA-methyltransferase [Alkalithermobacter thermoalcaliphilus JW-YL-7 = DSM 7308]|uniref:Adenine-specific DNA-methyltransferase n=1 Tax=Alkalithermobacter thermoalcaliphilus JW-YL-7 = DSM 7308 TaxID=1121328 RepID=A0A150FRE8_CLOPD|nr:Site-specific DNA-methyltransferase (adenine-specific) [[Clostridium] paradoxum JW-YL-7 = DSM 7308]SHK43605.1 adenine-specific DNA-methyltransferase [[Clostridium] paradoxum JW-YL-7 = DSM 7308]